MSDHLQKLQLASWGPVYFCMKSNAMKNLVTLTLALITFNIAFAQYTAVGIDVSTIAPVNNYCAKIQLERCFSFNQSIGLQLNYFADTTTSSGLVAEPYYRFYTGSLEDQHRFYLQLSTYAGQVMHTEVYDNPEENVLFESWTNNQDAFTQLFFSLLDMDEHQYITKRFKQNILGAGISCGFTHRFGNSNWSMYAQAGVKGTSYSTDVPETVIIAETTYTHVEGTIFNSTPQGYTTIDKSRVCNVFTGGLGITYSF